MEEQNKNYDMMIDPDKAKAAIIESHHTVQEAADAMGIEYGTLGNKLRGGAAFRLSDMIVLSKLTGKPIDWFLKADAKEGF